MKLQIFWIRMFTSFWQKPNQQKYIRKHLFWTTKPEMPWNSKSSYSERWQHTKIIPAILFLFSGSRIVVIILFVGCEYSTIIPWARVGYVVRDNPTTRWQRKRRLKECSCGLYRDYTYRYTLSKVGEPPWSWILRIPYKFRKRNRISSSLVYVIHKI